MRSRIVNVSMCIGLQSAVQYARRVVVVLSLAAATKHQRRAGKSASVRWQLREVYPMSSTSSNQHVAHYTDVGANQARPGSLGCMAPPVEALLLWAAVHASALGRGR
ncbi:hypothetical protein NX059_007648 [Plenodomus lindquistii]|nr:hypothetical protein NX059_007648 [Plenodomus lindquistii]